MAKLEFAWFIKKNLDFHVMDDSTIEVYRTYPRFRKLAVWIRPLHRLYMRKIATISINDLNRFIAHFYEKKVME